jgi:nucleoside 2-deoxyribosyltransferase
MIITICGSMQFHQEMLEAKRLLEERGFTVYIPIGAYDKSKNEFYTKSEEEKISFKIEHDLIHEHFHEIDKAEAILVLNYEKKGMPGYVGGNTFLEMGYAFGLGKKIYLLYPVPDMDYKVEMHSMKPVMLDGDLSNLQ